MIICPEFMTFFGINVFYPKAANYLGKILKQLLDDHAKNRRFGTSCDLRFENNDKNFKKSKFNPSHW
jgi:hypothetical protein